MIVYQSRILRPDRTPIGSWMNIDRDRYLRGMATIQETSGPTGLIYQFRAFTLVPVEVKE